MGSDSREPGRATAQELAELRRKIAAVPGRGESAAARLPTSEGVRRQTLPVPSALAELLPDGGLVTGSVVAYAGAGSLLAGLLAAVTAGGGHAAVVGMPKLGLLAAAEMGAQLGRIAVVADPGPDALEVAAVLLDGLDLVLLDLGGGAVAPARAKVIAARARNKGAVLVVTGGRWPAPSLRLGTRVAAYTGLRPRSRQARFDLPRRRGGGPVLGTAHRWYHAAAARGADGMDAPRNPRGHRRTQRRPGRRLMRAAGRAARSWMPRRTSAAESREEHAARDGDPP